MTSPENEGNDKEVFTLYATDGSFIIKNKKIKLKKSKKKHKKDVKTELENTRMDMIQ